jgi:hypothetical protein
VRTAAAPAAPRAVWVRWIGVAQLLVLACIGEHVQPRPIGNKRRAKLLIFVVHEIRSVPESLLYAIAVI